MESLNIQLQPFFEWLLRTTLQASLLICLILLVQMILRGRLGIRWHYCLWMLLLVRMVMPWMPQSRVSLFNLIPQSVPQRQTENAREEIGNKIATSDEASAEAGESTPTSTITVAQESPEPVTATPSVSPEADNRFRLSLSGLVNILPTVWLAGALLLAVYVCAGNFNLWRIVKRRRPLTDQKILDLLEDCKVQMGIQTILGIVPTDKVKSPALFGFVRPRLLLPQGMIETLSQEELRYVLLHELAHLKRHDIYIGWLISLLQVLHWFNPLIWLAFYRMRSDRELACDALVLARTQSGRAKDYGRIIVSLLERFSRSQRLPAMAGVLESKAQLKRRITMIARFKKNSYQWSPLAVIVIIILGCVSLPDAKRTKAAGISAAKPTSTISLRMVMDRWGTETCVSPDGGYMCYVDWTTSDLVVREIATGKMQRLTDKGSWGESNAIPSDPVISPDNTRVAYVRNYVEGKKRDLYVAALDGSGERLLCKGGEALPVPLDWSENGHEILAGIRGEDEKIHLLWVSASDGSIREITTLGEASPSRVDLSPHGRYVAYDYVQTDGESRRDIFVYDLKSQSQIAVVEHPADDKLLGWAPDGRSVFFASNRTGTWDGWIVEFGDAQLKHAPRLVKTALGDARPVGLTQKGEFYFGLTEYRSDVYAGRINIKTGEVIEAAKPVGQTGNEGDPDWSADGRYLAYCSRRPSDKSQVIRILSLESGKERELDPNLPYFRWFHWCPDGQSLLAGEFEGPSPQVIYRIDAETGQRSVFLGSEAHLIGAPAASNDGKKLLYIRRMRNKLGEHQSEAESERALVIRDLETGQEHELSAPKRPREHGSLIRFFVAPDGRRLALVVSEGDPFVSSKNYMHVRWPAVVLKTISAEDSRITELFRSENSEEMHSVAWTPDGRSLLFWRTVDPSPDHKAEEQTGLWRISAKGSEPEHFWTPKSWTPKAAVSDVRVHPGTGRVAFQARQQIWQLWVMENFLPEAPVARPAHQPNFRKIRIPTKPGNGVLSPDGEKLAFVSKESIWVVPVHGKVSPDIAGEPVKLTEAIGAFRWGMRWSADGKWIAYNTLSSEDHVGICIVPSSGGKVKRIVNKYRAGHRIHNYLLSLSPDGKKVVFASDEKEKIQLFTVNVEGGDVKQLTMDGGTQPAFSPDGKKIAYVKEKPQKTEIYKGSDVWVIPVAGGTPVQVSDLRGEATGPIWSLDGKMIAFTRKAILGSDMSKEICIVPVSETGKPEASPTQIELPLETWQVLAGWKPDNKIGTLLKNPIHFAIYTVPASGGNATQVTPQGDTFNPRWSPDGERIYFKLEDSIVSVPSDGGEISISPIDADSNFSLSWGGNAVSPDGKKTVFPASKIVFRDNKKDKEFGIYTIPVEGGEPKQLTISPGQDRFPCWSPDGNSIAFIRYSEASWNEIEERYIMNIFIVRPEGGEVRQLTSESDKVAWATIAWSPDGKSIAYYSEDNTIRIIPLQGGEPGVVAKVEEVSGWSEMDFSSDGKKIAYSSKGSIWVVSLDGGEPEEIKTGLDARATHLSWSPHGEKIAFTASQGGDTELWLMENFLPEAVASAGE